MSRLDNTDSTQDQIIRQAHDFDPLEDAPKVAVDLINSLIEICEDLDSQLSDKISSHKDTVDELNSDIIEKDIEIQNIKKYISSLEEEIEQLEDRIRVLS